MVLRRHSTPFHDLHPRHRRLAILGTDPRAPGRTWHLPTASPALTGQEYMSITTGGTGPQHTMSALTRRIGALFNPSARATLTTAYRYTDPYLFDSRSFETTFAMTPTPYEKGIADTLATISGIRT